MCLKHINICKRENYLKSDSHLLKKLFYFFQRKLFKNDEKCFLFYLKISFRSQDIQIFVLTFWPCKKNRFNWKYKVNFKIYDITTLLTKN